MVANDDFDSKATHLNCFYIHMIFEQKYPKPAIVIVQRTTKWLKLFTSCIVVFCYIAEFADIANMGPKYL